MFLYLYLYFFSIVIRLDKWNYFRLLVLLKPALYCNRRPNLEEVPGRLRRMYICGFWME